MYIYVYKLVHDRLAQQAVGERLGHCFACDAVCYKFCTKSRFNESLCIFIYTNMNKYVYTYIAYIYVLSIYNMYMYMYI